MNYQNNIIFKTKFGFIIYSIGLLLLISWIIVGNQFNLDTNSHSSIEKLSPFINTLYLGKPNLITLITYIIFTLSGFIFFKEKKKLYVFISISSFILLIFLFYKLIN